jgi:hypothetical protein
VFTRLLFAETALMRILQRNIEKRGLERQKMDILPNFPVKMAKCKIPVKVV